jgi:predicted DNA-binding protein
MSRSLNYPKVVHCRLSNEMHEQLVFVAKNNMMTPCEYIRYCVKKNLRRQSAKMTNNVAQATK